MKIIYADTYSDKYMHEMFNSASLKMISLLGYEVKYYASLESKKNVYNLIHVQLKNVQYYRIPVISSLTRIKHLLRNILSVLTSIYVLLSNNSNNVYIFNCNPILSLYPINIISKLLNRKVLIVCHGELQLTTKFHNFIFNCALENFRKGLFKPAKHLYFACLGDSILENIRNYYPDNISSKFISFDHPWIFRDKVSSKLDVNSSLIGIVGTLRNGEKLKHLVSLSKLINKENHLIVIGRVQCDFNNLDCNGIEYIAKDRILTREEIDAAISRCKFIIFLYSYEYYKFIASGAFFDSIDNEKFFLSLSNDYFDWMCQRFNNIGRTYNVLSKIADDINNHIELPLVNYKTIKYEFSPEYLAGLFKEQLVKINFLK